MGGTVVRWWRSFPRVECEIDVIMYVCTVCTVGIIKLCRFSVDTLFVG